MNWLDEMEASDPAYPGTGTAAMRPVPDVPVPYTLTPKAEALLARLDAGPAAGPGPGPEAGA